MEIFMDEFCVFGSSFDDCLSNLRKVLERCRKKNLTLKGTNVTSWLKRV